MKTIHSLLKSKLFGYSLFSVFILFFCFYQFYENQFSNTLYWSVLSFFYLLILLKGAFDWFLIIKKDDSGDIWLDQKTNYSRFLVLPSILLLIAINIDNYELEFSLVLILLVAIRLLFFTLESKKAISWIRDGELYYLYSDQSKNINTLKKISNPKNLILFTFSDDTSMELSLDFCRDRNLKRFLNELLDHSAQDISLDVYLTDFLERNQTPLLK